MGQLFGGIDWGSEEHAVCVLDETGHVRARWRVAHTAAGLASLLRALAALGAPGTIPLALERPSGLLVDTLVEAGHHVVPIHPNVVKASRPRYRAAGGKSDPEDAYILADLLRTDGHRFRRLCPLSDATRALRALVRTRAALVAERVALANQLRALLESFWPAPATLFAALDSPIALAFLAAYPTPAHAAHLGERRLAAFLRRRAYSGHRTPAELLARLHAAAPGAGGPAEATAKGALVRTFVTVLQTLGSQLQQLERRLAAAVAAHPDGALFRSFPRVGTVTAAQLVAELGDDRARVVSQDHFAADAGVAPVTYTSGKLRGVHFRRACNKRLRRALGCLADNSRHASPWAAAVYRGARTRGCTHQHAVRVLARAWVRVLWRCWQTHTPYDPRHHRAAQPFLVAA